MKFSAPKLFAIIQGKEAILATAVLIVSVAIAVGYIANSIDWSVTEEPSDATAAGLAALPGVDTTAEELEREATPGGADAPSTAEEPEPTEEIEEEEPEVEVKVEEKPKAKKVSLGLLLPGMGMGAVPGY